MKKRCLCILLLILLLMLSGCLNPISKLRFSGQDSTITMLREDGSLDSIYVEKFDEPFYDEDELKEYIDGEIEQMNHNRGKESVKRASFQVKEGIAKLYLKYDSVDSYNEFNVTSFYSGSLDDTELKGPLFDLSGKQVQVEELDRSLKLISTEEAIQVQVPGRILYVSEGVTIEKDDVAVMSQDGISYILYE
ncbi:MAG: hypothetical protein ACI4CT_01665 [Lachnospiraceae bacterium]